MEQTRAFRIITPNKAQIAATLFSKEKPSNHLIIISPAAGAVQRYYQGFAKYASEHKDFDVVTFDYEGIGQSLDTSLCENKSTMSDWGANDLAAVIGWADRRYVKIFLLGHSVAGQVFPKAHNHTRVSAAYFVGSQSAYHGHWGGLSKLWVLFFWYLLVPVTLFIYDYLPGWTMGGKVAFPERVAREWRSWGTHPEGVLRGDERIRRRFASVKMPLHFVAVGDDKVMAPAKATQALMNSYKNAKTTYQFIEPKNLSIEGVGHFGFFRKKFMAQLWPLPMFYFAQYVNKFN